ncbi:MAG: hypothetical protein K8U57_38095 [Planctomycetes bacterium]|nr:hypothetical protein [Planctomycetota bacterium]
MLLVLARFARPADAATWSLPCLPADPFEMHFASEYYLQKLDFLLRYPAYFVYELTELHYAGDESASDAEEVKATIRRILEDQEPELQTIPFRKFWRGAYERLDDVEAWWLSRRLVYTKFELRGQAAPWKHYFLTKQGAAVADRLRNKLEHAAWYARRIDEIHRYMGHLSASDIKSRQYRHERYRLAQISELIPDLTVEEIRQNFQDVFAEPLEVVIGQETPG